MVPMSNVGALETGLGGARVVDGTPLRAGASKRAQTSGNFWECNTTVPGWVSDPRLDPRCYSRSFGLKLKP